MILLALDKKYYFPKDTVSGMLILRTKRPLHVSKLIIKISKKWRGLIYKDETKSIYYSDKDSARSYEHEFVMAEDTAFASGEHIFPFKFMLSHKEEGSTRIVGLFEDLRCSVENKHIIEAMCVTGDEVLTAEVVLPVFNITTCERSSESKVKLPGRICFSMKEYLFKLVTDKDVYKAGDTVEVDIFPISIVPRALFKCARVSLYEIVSITKRSLSITKSRPLSEVKAVEIDKNCYKARIRIPTNASATLSDGDIIMRTALFVVLKNSRGKSIHMKMYINIGRIPLEIPQIVEPAGFKGKVYSEKLLNF